MSRNTTYRSYSDSFKATAVRLSYIEGIRSKDVAESLDIHPLMLSRWRKWYREGRLMASGKEIKLDKKEVTELQRLRELEKKYKLLQEEHSLLKKAIRFTLERKKKSSNSSKRTGKDTK